MKIIKKYFGKGIGPEDEADRDFVIEAIFMFIFFAVVGWVMCGALT